MLLYFRFAITGKKLMKYQLTAIARPRGTEMNRTPKKEHRHAKKSSLSTFHSLYAD